MHFSDNQIVDAVAAGADVNARDEQGQTPLFWAIQKSSLAAVKVLIEAGADVTVCDDDGQSTLDLTYSPDMRQLLARAWPQDHPLRLHALFKADLADEVVEAVAAGADVNARDEQGQTPLFWASERNRLVAAEALVEANADVTICNNDGRSALELAWSLEMRQLLARAWPEYHPLWLHALATAGLADEVAEAVAAGADVNARDEQGQTPLFWAIKRNSLAAAEVLIKTGADATICDIYEQSTLDWARSLKVRQLLARAWPQDHPHRLHALATAGLADEVVEAVAAGADVNARDEDGRTPLFWATQKDCLTAIEVLVKAGADVSICDNRGRRALDWAESPEACQLLARAWPEYHPLWLHALTKADLIDELVEAVAAGADVNARDEDGQTPLFWAIQNDSLAAAEMLIETGADVDARDELGQTPLFWAAENDSLAAVEMLDKAGADVTIRDNDGQSIQDCLMSYKMRELLGRVVAGHLP